MVGQADILLVMESLQKKACHVDSRDPSTLTRWVRTLTTSQLWTNLVTFRITLFVHLTIRLLWHVVLWHSYTYKICQDIFVSADMTFTLLYLAFEMISGCSVTCHLGFPRSTLHELFAAPYIHDVSSQCNKASSISHIMTFHTTVIFCLKVTKCQLLPIYCDILSHWYILSNDAIDPQRTV